MTRNSEWGKLLVVIMLMTEQIVDKKRNLSMKELKSINYWIKQTEDKFPHSAQAVLLLENSTDKKIDTSTGCGQGSCNCGGGCNGECGSCS